MKASVYEKAVRPPNVSVSASLFNAEGDVALFRSALSEGLNKFTRVSKVGGKFQIRQYIAATIGEIAPGKEILSIERADFNPSVELQAGVRIVPDMLRDDFADVITKCWPNAQYDPMVPGVAPICEGEFRFTGKTPDAEPASAGARRHAPSADSGPAVG